MRTKQTSKEVTMIRRVFGMHVNGRPVISAKKGDLKLIMPLAAYKFQVNYPEVWESFGCGPGGFGDFLIPDTMWGYPVTEPCRIHDWEYRYNLDRSDRARKYADERLLANLKATVIDGSSNFVTRRLRTIRCYTYYFFVRAFGGSSWNDG